MTAIPGTRPSPGLPVRARLAQRPRRAEPARPRGARARLSAATLLLALASCGGGASPPPAAPSAAADEPAEAPAAEDTAQDTTEAAPAAPATLAAAPAESAAPAAIEPVALPQPPFERFVAGELAGAGRAGKPKLVQVSKKRNQITDRERWFRELGVTLPVSRQAPEGLSAFRGVPLLARIDGDPTLLVYQAYTGPESYLLGVDPGTGEVRFAFDFSAFRLASGTGEGGYVVMEIRWAQVRGDRLYISHAHRTYAESSQGRNAYVTALRIPDGALLWRSQPLVSNTHNFVLLPAGEGEVLITGYGFTAEPDFMYLLDPETGAVLSKTKVDSGPGYIVPLGDRIHVRTYDRDYVFRLQP